MSAFRNSWERMLAGVLITAGLAVWLYGYGVLAAALLIFGGAALVDAWTRARRERATLSG